MPRRRYVFSLFLATLGLLLACCHPARAQAVKDLPRPTDYVSDYAHVLSPALTQQLDILCGEVDHQAHAQIAVVTIRTTGDEPINEYAVELEDAWKVGPKGSDRGLILLLAVDDHKRWIETGYGLEGILPDGKVGQIGRAMVPYLDRNDYNGAVSMAVNQMAGIIAQDAGVTLQAPSRRMRGQQQQVHLSLGQLLVFAVIAIVLLWIASRLGLLPFLFGMLLGNALGGGGGGGGRDDDDDSGSGSGFGGFGGGSTGGGGAGGDW